LIRDVEGRTDWLDSHVLRVSLEVVGSKSIFDKRNNKVDIFLLGVPGGQSVDSHMVEVDAGQEGNVRFQVIDCLLH